jgi:hypothetical protein
LTDNSILTNQFEKYQYPMKVSKLSTPFVEVVGASDTTVHARNKHLVNLQTVMKF